MIKGAIVHSIIYQEERSHLYFPQAKAITFEQNNNTLIQKSKK
jgi:hypothetical protein